MPSYFDRKNLVQPFEAVVDGHRYTLSFHTSVASLASTYLQIKTGNADCVILYWQVGSTDQPLDANAIESPTVTDGTTPVVAYNRNRQSLETPTTLFYSNPTSISGGTTILHGAISAAKGAGGEFGLDTVWVLKRNTSYVWQVTNTGNNTTTVNGRLDFTETVLP